MRPEGFRVRILMAALLLGGCARVDSKNGDKSNDPLDATATEVFTPELIGIPGVDQAVTEIAVATEVPTQIETITPREAETISGFVLDEVNLDNVAKTYLADTTQKAIDVAQAINWFPNNLDEHPSNMCGPLSGQILIDAGIIKPLTRDELKNIFWLAKADRDKNMLLAAFPEDQFDWNFVDSAFGTYDFSANPLEPGDWIYLTADKGGSFEHMLTVTRVERDAEGKIVAAYSVNNVYVGTTADGTKQYNIVESKLYDTRTGGHYEYGYPNYKFGASTGSTFFIVRRKDIIYSGDTSVENNR